MQKMSSKYTLLVWVLAALFVTACSTQPRQADHDAPASQVADGHAQAAHDKASQKQGVNDAEVAGKAIVEPEPIDSNLSPELLFRLMVAEISGQRGHINVAVKQYLEGKAATAEVPPDLCYVNNFTEPHRPRFLELPTGRGSQLQKAMRRLLEEVRPVLETALESEDYQTRKQVLEKKFEERQGEALSDLGNKASKKGLALVRTPVGIVFAPVGEEEVLSPEDFQKLPEKEQKRLEKEIDAFKEDLQKVLRQFPRWQRQATEALRELDLEVSRFAVKPLFDELREQFEGLAGVQAFLDAAEDDFVENASRLGSRGEKPTSIAMDAISGGDDSEKPSLRRYRVNLLVDHGKSKGAPVIYEDNPTYPNLVGRIEHISQMGAVVTDFNLIKPGALHRARGGYLLVDALKILQQPYAYEGLNRALQSKRI